MQGWIEISGELKRKFGAYRQQRRAERGKTIQSTTAIRELLAKALEGIEPPKPLEDRLVAIERRLSKLEEELSDDVA